jgi:cell division protein FtsX
MTLSTIITTLKSEIANPRHNNWLASHLRTISMNNLFQTIGLMLMIASLVFLLNVIGWLKLWLDQAVGNVKGKLWVYLYIKSIPSQEDRITEQVIEMKTALEAQGMEVQYYSRKDAFDTLSKKLPDVVESFDKYGISNPLPATMYIMFRDSSQYDILKTIASKYQPIIVNSLDTTRDTHLRKQEQRVINVINLGNVVTIISFWLVLFLIAIIVVFLLFIIRIKFYGFKDVIQVQKLLGASYTQIKWPYLVHIGLILTCGVMIAAVAMWICQGVTQGSMITLFNKSLLELVGLTGSQTIVVLIVELIGIGLVSAVVGNIFLDKLLKKI